MTDRTLNSAADERKASSLFGCLVGSVRTLAGFDFTAPVLDEVCHAGEGRLLNEQSMPEPTASVTKIRGRP